MTAVKSAAAKAIVGVVDGHLRALAKQLGTDGQGGAPPDEVLYEVADGIATIHTETFIGWRAFVRSSRARNERFATPRSSRG